MALQDKVLVRVKAERDASSNCTENVRISRESMGSNRSANVGSQSYNHTRQQIVHRDEAIQGERTLILSSPLN